MVSERQLRLGLKTRLKSLQGTVFGNHVCLSFTILSLSVFQDESEPVQRHHLVLQKQHRPRAYNLFAKAISFPTQFPMSNFARLRFSRVSRQNYELSTFSSSLLKARRVRFSCVVSRHRESRNEEVKPAFRSPHGLACSETASG